MNLLIVDDQACVVDGLVMGISWRDLEIREVYKADSAAAARDVIQKRRIDLMLCDIEMPKESGLDLYHWIREQGFEICCIFLTSHAEFQYAQEALRCGAFDYILQPADYRDVYRVVERAVEAIRLSRGKQELYQMGEAFHRQKRAIINNTLRDHLQGIENGDDLQRLQKLGELPTGEVYLVLFEIVSWRSVQEQTEAPVLAETLGGVATEIFKPGCYETTVASMENNQMAMLIWQDRNEEMLGDFLKNQLSYLANTCGQRLKCELTCYLGVCRNLAEIREKWMELKQWSAGDIVKRKGVFLKRPSLSQENGYRTPKIELWKKMMEQGYYQAVEKQAIEFLDQMVSKNALTERELGHFYQEYLILIYQRMQGREAVLYELLDTAEGMDVYRNGMRSVQKMKELIRLTMTAFTAPALEEEKEKQALNRMKQYIATHLEQELHREDIAGHVFLNPDYASRIFKSETGMTLKAYITEQKMQTAKSLLQTTKLPVNVIGAKLGYKNFSHFSHTYKKIMGRNPQEEREA